MIDRSHGLLPLAAGIAAILCSAGAAAAQGPTQPDDVPAGTLRAVGPDGAPLGDCPLEHTDVEIEVSGFVARARVTHRFSNPFEERIEAVYTFPLPEDAAVRDMEMRVGDRLVRAEIRRRDDAREDYEAARDRGQTASLLDQERPNIFTSSVANIRPGVPVLVTLEYVQTLKYESGRYELTFPMTVGPRYIPGTVATGVSGTGQVPDTDRVPDASRITPPIAPTGRSGHDIALRVSLDSGSPMDGAPVSPTHDIVLRRTDASRAQIAIAAHDTIPNADFVLRWRVSPERVGTAVLTHRPSEDEDGFVTLLLQPNAQPPVSEITPKEIVFVLDTSGSMYGRPMEISKALMDRMLASLHPRDTFAVLRYSDDHSALSPRPLANTPANVRRARAFVGSLDGEGGTDALGGVRAAFAYPRDPRRLRIVVFMTDGYIGSESEILTEIRSRIGDARLFSVGIGSSVNRYLLEGMALEGRGDARIVTPDEDAGDAVARLFRRLESPYLTDIEIDWGGLRVSQPYPARMPDLFAGEPLEVHARYAAAGSGTVTVRGRMAGRPFEQAVQVSLPARDAANAAIGSVWARARIGELSRELYEGETPELVEEITQVALAHRLMSPYTSFLAVESVVVEETDAMGRPRQVVVPVEIPEGVSPARLGRASLSLARFQPGDPELRVHVSPDARAVTAVFPFGETMELSWDVHADAWTCRFLVPRDTPEGNYTIQIIVTHRDGRQERIREPYTVDSSAPDVALSFLSEVRPGAEVEIEARQRFTDRDRALHGRRRRVQILSDVARLRVTTEDGAPVVLRMIEPGLWRGTFTVPDDVGDSTALEVTAYDVAGNRGGRTVTVEVAR